MRAFHVSNSLYAAFTLSCAVALLGCDDTAPSHGGTLIIATDSGSAADMSTGGAGATGGAGGQGGQGGVGAMGGTGGQGGVGAMGGTGGVGGVGGAGGIGGMMPVDECATDNGGCGDPQFTTCADTPDGAPVCTDIDECATDNGGCGDAAFFTCANNEGAAPTCADIDECATDNGGCGDGAFFTCTNNEGAAPTCADIDECATDNGGCGDAAFFTCTNNEGAAPTCVDIDECLVDNGGCGDADFFTCTNNEGAAPTCVDIDECLVDNGGCGDLQFTTCANNEGAAPTCGDVDECLINNGDCGDAEFFSCTNNEGAAPTCADIDECVTDNGGCGEAAFFSCTNNEGAAPTCADIDECAVDNGGCGDAQFTTCTNNEGAAPTCADIDECAVDNGGCGDPEAFACVNHEGAAPTCNEIGPCDIDNGGCGDPDFINCEVIVVLNRPGVACLDIDECAVDNGGCGDAQRFTCTNNRAAPPTCADLDECVVDNGGCGDPVFFSCTNNEGAAPTCADIDECATDNGGCGDAEFITCTNNEGAAPGCSDIDECAIDNGGCGDPAEFSCTNLRAAAPNCRLVDRCSEDNGGCGDPNFYNCLDEGGDTPVCSDIDECAIDNGGCGDVVLITCTNNDGAAPTCTDIDECAVDNGACGASRFFRCTNNEAAAPTCEDIDECLINNGGCGNPSRFACANNEGAEPTCTDIDECLTDNGGCGDAAFVTCTNRVGEPPLCADIDECAENNGGCPEDQTCRNQDGAAPICSFCGDGVVDDDRDEACDDGDGDDANACRNDCTSCFDSIQNGDEERIDCGGSCADCPALPPFRDGQRRLCEADNECDTGVCRDGVCGLLPCVDGILNGAESDVDCGAEIPDPLADRIESISTWASHSCAIVAGGDVYCWGLGGEGRLGTGSTGRAYTPQRIELGEGRRAIQVSTGANHTCALLDGGEIKCWGDSANGKLGIPTPTDDQGDEADEMGDVLPVLDLGEGRTATMVVAGGSHTCAILDGGDLKCWGASGTGQLGIDFGNQAGGRYREVLAACGFRCFPEPSDYEPIDLGEGLTVQQVALGNAHTCALLNNGQVKCWGENQYGRLGLGDSDDRGLAPETMGDALPAVNLGGGRTALAIAVGYAHSCALLDDRTVKCWGQGSFGRLGQDASTHLGDGEGEMGNELPPINLGDERTAVAISAGSNHTCAVLDDASAKCWGQNSNAQLGQDSVRVYGNSRFTSMASLDPINLGDGRTAQVITAGATHTCVLLDDWTSRCWGSVSLLGLGSNLGMSSRAGDAPGEMAALPSHDYGALCRLCVAPEACRDGSNCVNGQCEAGVCVVSCDDGVQNGDEGGIDCGGPECDLCVPGQGCNDAADCRDQVCRDGVCAAAACDDGVQNGLEIDVDCGSEGCGGCPLGAVCIENIHCEARGCIDGVCVEPACDDGFLNGDEFNIDCGGSCPGCADGQPCDEGANCASNLCVDNVCASCENGIIDGDEVDVDCGGSNCDGCDDGELCNEDGDCRSESCLVGAALPTPGLAEVVDQNGKSQRFAGYMSPGCGGCPNRVSNMNTPILSWGACRTAEGCATEFCELAGWGPPLSYSEGFANDVFAGPFGTHAVKAGFIKFTSGGSPQEDRVVAIGVDGVLAPWPPNRDGCNCIKRVVRNVVCAMPEARCVSCENGIRDGFETGIDCGTPSCGACDTGLGCSGAADCVSMACGNEDTGETCDLVCDEAGNECLAATCEDTIQNGSESDVDCGGGECDLCAVGQACGAGSDCVTGVCSTRFGLVSLQCQPPSCDDDVQNGDEDDIDCGGSDDCRSCRNGAACANDAVCLSGWCHDDDNVCSPITCEDGYQNGSETDVDCGGPDCGACITNQRCNEAADCIDGICDGDGLCAAPTCDDGVQNGGEVEVDCGGANACLCETDEPCDSPENCRSGVCSDDGACEAPVCGDGVVNAPDGSEPCDDGNLSNSDACLNDCRVAACGDGFVQLGVEECDDANDNPLDGCQADCSVWSEQYCVGACDAAGTRELTVETQSVKLIGTNDEGTGSMFGSSVAMDGDTAVVGAPLYQVAPGEDRDGRVRIYQRDAAGDWVWQQDLVYPEAIVGAGGPLSARFGSAVALEGDRLVIGAPKFRVEGSRWGDDGAAYIYTRNAQGVWEYSAQLIPSRRTSRVQFGTSVAVSGDLVVVGAPGRSTSIGDSFVFLRQGDGAWEEVYRWRGDARNADRQVGFSVAAQGNSAFVSGDSARINGVSSAGVVYVIQPDENGDFGVAQTLVASDAGFSMRFGRAIAARDNRVVIGTYRRDGNGMPATGDQIYVFEPNEQGLWQEEGILTAGASVRSLGMKLSLSGSRILAGAGYQDAPGAEAKGSAFLYEATAEGQFVLKREIVSADGHADERFGMVAIDGTSLLVGAPEQDDEDLADDLGRNLGAAYFYDLDEAPVCTSDGACVCRDGWQGADCSEESP